MELRFYGNQKVYHGLCCECKEENFIVNGCCIGCGMEVPMPEHATERRVSTIDPTAGGRKHLSQRAKKKILVAQAWQCYYCAIDLRDKGIKVHYDHFVPWISVKETKEHNMVAACSRCNLVKSSMVFDSRESAAEYILQTRIGKGDEINWDTTYYGEL